MASEMRRNLTSGVNGTRNGQNSSDDCFNVSYELKTEETHADAEYMALAVIFGLLSGALLAIFVCLVCCKKWIKTARVEVQPVTAVMDNARRRSIKLFGCCKRNAVGDVNRENRSRNRSVQIGYRRIASDANMDARNNEEFDDDDEVSEPETDVTNNFGMAEILLKRTRNEKELELARQDENWVDDMERSMINRRQQLSVLLFENLLLALSQGSNADRRVVDRVVEGVQAILKELNEAVETEIEEKRAKIVAGTSRASISEQEKYSKELLEVEYRRNKHNIFKHGLAEVSDSVRKSTKLTETQIQEILEKLRSGLAELERVLNDHLDIEMEALYTRTANREAHVEQFSIFETEFEKDLSDRETLIERALEDKKLSDAKKKAFLERYKEQISELRDRSEEDFYINGEKIAERLKAKRQESLSQMRERYKSAFGELLKTSKSHSSETVLTSLYQMLEQQTAEIARFWKDTDQDETAKLTALFLKFSREAKAKCKELTDELINSYGGEGRETLKRQHQMDVAELEKRHETERQMTRTDVIKKLNEKLTETLKKLNGYDSIHQRVLNGQAETVQMVLETRPNFHENDKQKLLSEFEHQKHAFNNMMKLSRLKQEKHLERKLRRRRSSVSALQAARDGKRTVTNEQRRKAENDLADRLALEMQTHLDQQTLDLADTVARMQVGAMRRQSLIFEEDKLLRRLSRVREMELELREKSLKEKDVESWRLTKLLDEHKQQVARLDEKLLASKEQQMATLASKLEEKRQKIQQSVAKRFDQEEAEVLRESLKSKLSMANTMMYQNKLERRKRQALQRSEAQLNADWQLERQKLHQNLRWELDQKLIEQREQFIANLTELVNGNFEQGKREQK